MTEAVNGQDHPEVVEGLQVVAEDQAAYPVIVVTASTTDVDFTIQPVEPECKVVDGHQAEVVHGAIIGDSPLVLIGEGIGQATTHEGMGLTSKKV